MTVIGGSTDHLIVDRAGNAQGHAVLEVQTLAGVPVTDVTAPSGWTGQAFPTGKARADADGYFKFVVPDATGPVQVRSAAVGTKAAGKWLEPSGQVVPGSGLDQALEGKLGVAAASATYARTGVGGFFIDVTSPDYGAVGDGVADDFAAINSAALALEAFGGGTVYMPKGTYRISAHLPVCAYVGYLGAGMGATIVRPYQSAAFTGHGTLEAPIESPAWQDMTWDGADIPAANSLKGQFSEFLRNALWQRVECKNFTATGFGSDFLPGGQYLHCIATGNGRGQAVGDPGMSGIGIGTGKYEVEDVLVQGCMASGNTNYGIFVEKQGAVGNAPYYSKGVRIVSNYVTGNGWGIGGCGVEAPVYSSNICAANTFDGIVLHEGTGAVPLGQPDKRASIMGNQCYDNGRDGINLDYEKNSIPANQAYHMIAANTCRGNGRDGVHVIGSKWASDVLRGIKIYGNLANRNAGQGINIVKPPTAEAGASIADLNIHDNDVNGNGGNGITLDADTLRLRAAGNKVYDDQAVKTQDYGIAVLATRTQTDAHILDNDLRGNLVSGMQVAGTIAGTSEVGRNRGSTYIAAAPQVQLGPKVTTKATGAQSVVALQNNDAASGDNATRVYIVPKASVTAGAGGVLKIFGDDYTTDQVNYRDFGLYFSQDQNGETGTRGDGAFYLNVKSNGTKAGTVPDLIFSMQDGVGVVARAASPIVGGQSKYTFVIGPGKPEHSTKRALVLEVQGDVGFDGAADRSIYWENTGGGSVNMLSFERHAAGGNLRLKLGGVNRALFGTAGDLVLGDQTGDLATTSTVGFFHIRTTNGTPTGVPIVYPGAIPLLIDRATDKFWWYNNGWKSMP